MFSVPASPYNSRARALYGGWANTHAGDADTVDTLRAYYASHPASYYYDSKWATFAQRFAPDVASVKRAKLIKAAGKGMLPVWRQNPNWREGYAAALAGKRTTYRRPSFNELQKRRLWNTFQNIPFETDAAQNLWLSLATKSPYTSQPAVPGDVLTAQQLAALTTGQYFLPDQVNRFAPLLENMQEGFADQQAAIAPVYARPGQGMDYPAEDAIQGAPLGIVRARNA